MNIVFVIAVGIVMFIETFLWIVFHRKIKGLVFDKKYDESFFRFFTEHRLLLVAIAHTIFLLISLLLCVLLW